MGDGRISADFFKFALSLFANAPERMSQPIRRIDPLRCCMALGANGTSVDGGLIHAGNPGKAALFDKGINTAAASRSARAAHPTHGGDDRFAIQLSNMMGLLKIHKDLIWDIIIDFLVLLQLKGEEPVSSAFITSSYWVERVQSEERQPKR